jgi:putative spermidine/putrescine transport system ATP-binding protein
VAGHNNFVVKLPNKAGNEHLCEGAAVKVSWKATDCRALDYLELSH